MVNRTKTNHANDFAANLNLKMSGIKINKTKISISFEQIQTLINDA